MWKHQCKTGVLTPGKMNNDDDVCKRCKTAGMEPQMCSKVAAMNRASSVGQWVVQCRNTGWSVASVQEADCSPVQKCCLLLTVNADVTKFSLCVYQCFLESEPNHQAVVHEVSFTCICNNNNIWFDLFVYFHTLLINLCVCLCVWQVPLHCPLLAFEAQVTFHSCWSTILIWCLPFAIPKLSVCKILF